MKTNHPPSPALEQDGDGTGLPALSRKKAAPQTVWQGLAATGSLGFTLVGCTFLGLFAGYYLDRWLETHPLLTILLLLFGIAAGFVNIFVYVSRSRPPRNPGNSAAQSDAARK